MMKPAMRNVMPRLVKKPSQKSCRRLNLYERRQRIIENRPRVLYMLILRILFIGGYRSMPTFR